MDLRDIGLGCVDWIDVVQDRNQWKALVNTVMNLRAPKNITTFLSSCTTCGFSKSAHLRGVSLIVSLLYVRSYKRKICAIL
jgi:hypothetical protein